MAKTVEQARKDYYDRINKTNEPENTNDYTDNNSRHSTVIFSKRSKRNSNLSARL